MGHPIDPADDPPSRRPSRPRSLITSSYFLKRLEQHHKTLSSLTPSTSYEAGDYPTFARSKSRERSARQDARSKLRAYLHGSTNGKADSSDDDEEEQRGLPGIAKSVKHRLSRVGTASSTSQLSSPGASTSQLSISSNPQLDTEDSARMVEEIKEKAYMDSIAARNHVSSPIDEDMHVDSIPSPIRRKSLYTPGIATRTPNDILRKPPPPQILQSPADREYYFNPKRPTSSPLARLAALEIGKSGRSTPNLDYSHLGGLRLGTLRVTNGPPSPKLQEVIPHQLDTPTQDLVNEDDDLEAMAEEKRLGGTPVAASGSSQSSEEAPNISSSNLPIENESSSSSADQGKQRDTDSRTRLRRSGSPLKHEHMIDDKDFDETSSRSAHTKWLNRKQSLPSGFFSTSSDSASALAFDHIQALPDIPFQRAQTTAGDSPKSRCESNPDETDDVSFEDEGLVMCKSYRSALEMWRSFVHDADQKKTNSGTREDAYKQLNANSACQQSTDSRPTSSSASTKTMDSRSISTYPSTIKSSKKADSGYSSSESISLSNKAPPDHVAVAVSVRGTSDSGSMKSFRFSGTRNVPRSLSRTAKTNDAATPADKPKLPCPSKVAVVQPLSAAVYPTGVDDILPKENSPSQNLVIPSPRSVSRTRKLGKAKRSSLQLPVNSIVVQVTRQLSQSEIPEVPKDIALKHAERLHKFPLLDHTSPTLQDNGLDESLLREEPKFVPIRFPSPTQSLERADSICNSDLDWPSKRSNKSKKIKSASKSSPIKSSKAGRRSSQTEDLVAITDFGTVTECLGGNPYDVATSASSHAWKRASISHPHQISTAIPRAKSMTEMTNQSALASAKSLGRFSIQSFSRRSTSPFRSFDSLDKITGKLVHPHCTIIDAPPVPALPVEYSGREKRGNVPQSFELFSQEPSEQEQPPRRLTRPRSLIIVPRVIPTTPAKDKAKPRSPEMPGAFEPRRKSFNDRGGIPGKLSRPRSMLVNAPPVPVLPSKSQLEHIEAQACRSSLSKRNTVAAPLKVQKPKEKPVDAVGKSTEESQDSAEYWKSHREAWSQRRKSAGDALLLRSQIERSSKAPTTFEKFPSSLRLPEPASAIQNSSNNPIQSPTAALKQRRPPLRHISQSQSPPTIESGLTASPQDVSGADKSSTSTPANIDTLAGRFAGGFHYGYEPGFGLGGSAGTRIAQSTASRKSVHVSRGYGLDLSDVPVFVIPR